MLLFYLRPSSLRFALYLVPGTAAVLAGLFLGERPSLLWRD